MKKIIKYLIYQNKYSRYKYLFSINIDDIISLGTEKFLLILKNIGIKEEKTKIKYFRLEDIYHDDYFSNENGYLFLKINNFENIENKIKALKILEKSKTKFKLIYEIEINKNSFENDLFKYLKDKNYLIFYIKSNYKNSEIEKYKKLKKYLKEREIFIGLDYIKSQDEVENENIFFLIKSLEENKNVINKDFIRLESVWKKIYVIGPKELHLDLYEYCNASCTFCYTNGPGFLTERGNKENNYKQKIDLEKYINLFKKIKNSFTENLALGITGEPFLYPEIKGILKELVDIPIKVGFLTNGYKLLENIDLILENKNISHFYINISAGNLKSFKVTRPNDNFKNFLNSWEAIKIIREKRPDIIVRGLYVITPENICGVEDFLKLAQKNNISEVELKRVVPYEFSDKKFYFDEKDIDKIINIVDKFNNEKFKINQNFDYIINEFNEVKKGNIIQYPEGEDENNTKLVGKTIHCYNSYFYISLFRNTSYTCGKFEAKIGKLTNLDLYSQLFEKKEVRNILLSGENIKNFLGEGKWKSKCSRCHHMDVNNMVSEYIKIKKIIF